MISNNLDDKIEQFTSKWRELFYRSMEESKSTDQQKVRLENFRNCIRKVNYYGYFLMLKSEDL